MLHHKHESYRCVLPLKIQLIRLALGQKKILKLKNVPFEKKGLTVKKHKILHFITTFHNFTIKIETSWAKRLVKLILDKVKKRINLNV